MRLLNPCIRAYKTIHLVGYTVVDSFYGRTARSYRESSLHAIVRILFNWSCEPRGLSSGDFLSYPLAIFFWPCNNPFRYYHYRYVDSHFVPPRSSGVRSHISSTTPHEAYSSHQPLRRYFQEDKTNPETGKDCSWSVPTLHCFFTCWFRSIYSPPPILQKAYDFSMPSSRSGSTSLSSY